jgi:hypothetical protein
MEKIMRQKCFLFILLHLSFSFTSGLKQKLDLSSKTDLKTQITEFCTGKYEDFCSVGNLVMLNKIIDDKAKELRIKQMKKMKDNIVNEIRRNLETKNKHHVKNRIVKEIIRNIQG